MMTNQDKLEYLQMCIFREYRSQMQILEMKKKHLFGYTDEDVRFTEIQMQVLWNMIESAHMGHDFWIWLRNEERKELAAVGIKD